MGNGASTGAKVSSQDRAILEMKVQRDKLRLFQRKVEQDADRFTQLARQALRQGRKDRARLLLQQKHFQEGNLRRVDEQLAALEQLTASVEFGRVQQSVVFGLEQGNRVLKELNRQAPIDRIDRIMDDNAEAQAYQAEIAQALANALSLSEQEAVELEFARLEEQERLAFQQDLPSVPRDSLKAQLPQSDEVADAAEAFEDRRQGAVLAA